MAIVQIRRPTFRQTYYRRKRAEGNSLVLTRFPEPIAGRSCHGRCSAWVADWFQPDSLAAVDGLASIRCSASRSSSSGRERLIG
jgi:hypothetical protein